MISELKGKKPLQNSHHKTVDNTGGKCIQKRRDNIIRLIQRNF